jgi:hypothetical protein
MIYINFSNDIELNYFDNFKDQLISIPLDRNLFSDSENILEKNYFKGYRKIEFENFNENLWALIQEWVAINFPKFSKKTIKFCTYHLSSHFSLNYVSTYSIIKNIIELNNDSEFTILCPDDILSIESDWCSNIISVIAASECFDNHGKKYLLHANLTNTLKDLIESSSLKYSPLNLLENNSFKLDEFNYKISQFEFISYQLTNRHNFLKTNSNNLNIIPKSLIIENNKIGSYLQFENNSESTFNFKEWPKNNILNNFFSNQLFSNFFNSIGVNLFPKLIASYQNLKKVLPHDKKQSLIIEEIVDLEAMPIISIFAEFNREIIVTQHSNDPITKPLELTNGLGLANTVYVNNKHSHSCYSQFLEAESIVFNPNRSIENNVSPYSNYTFKPTIIIIENDYFRKFGMPFNICELHRDIYSFILNLQNFTSKFNILWRQRSSDYNPIYIDLKSKFQNINFFFDYSLDIAQLKAISNISIGFGTTSSFAFTLARNGIINFFGSSELCDHEYLLNISEFHSGIGPEYCAHQISDILLNNKEIYYKHLNRQQDFIINY